MLNQHACVGCETTDGASQVTVNFKDLFNAARNDQFGGEPLLHCQHHTFVSLDSDGCGSQLQDEMVKLSI